MNRRFIVSILVLSLHPFLAWADSESGSGVAQGLSSLIGLTSLFILSLGATAGVMGLSALLLSSQPARAQLESLSSLADRSPRKTLAVGLAAGTVSIVAAILMLHAPPLKLAGLAWLALLTAGTVKGFISRVLSAGRMVGRECAAAPNLPFREAFIGAVVFEMVFLMPLVGQLFVALATAQGFGAWVLLGFGAASTPVPQEPSAASA